MLLSVRRYTNKYFIKPGVELYMEIQASRTRLPRFYSDVTVFETRVVSQGGGYHCKTSNKFDVKLLNRLFE